LATAERQIAGKNWSKKTYSYKEINKNGEEKEKSTKTT
jgi:hypothetical protein